MTSTVFAPLKGIRVLSFEIAFALPAGTRALHDLGANVVRVPRPGGTPASRYIGVIDGVFHGKSAIGLDLTKASGRRLAFDLAMQADVVCNNFRVGTMAKYGLGAEQLRAAKPELIWLQLSGYGSPGPWSGFPAYGPSTEAAGGMNRLMVDEGEVPIRIGTGVFSDQLSGRFAALAVASALLTRRQTGKGATIDQSMSEAITHLMGPLVVKAAIMGEVPKPDRNRSPDHAPQGLYRCRGDDEWIAISVRSNKDWHYLCDLVGDLDPRLGLAARQARHNEIDRSLAAWTTGQDKNEIAIRLQGLGIAAAPVRTVVDGNLDPQFKSRGSLAMTRHPVPVLGQSAHPHAPLPWRIVGRRRRKLTDYRLPGQDNHAVLKSWLGLDADRIRALETEGALFSEQPLDITEPPYAKANVDPDFADKLELPE